MFKDLMSVGERVAIEIQYCRLPDKYSIKKKVAVSSVTSKSNDSLYVLYDDINEFLKLYLDVFSNGTYNNLQSRNIDVFGINYYSNEDVKVIIKRLIDKKPDFYITLLNWLENANYNGIYILRI